MRVPCASKTTSKLLVNFRSWSRMRDRTGSARSESVHATCRACCVTHSPSGWAVQPARYTRRVASSMKNSTYNRWSQIVSTLKKSTAITPFARTEELTPRWAQTLARWAEVFRAEDLLDRSRRNGNAQSFQFANDALIAPLRILACQRHD